MGNIYLNYGFLLEILTLKRIHIVAISLIIATGVFDIWQFQLADL